MGWDATHLPDQHGKRVIVTGANSGIGYDAAAALAMAGAAVVLACRSEERGSQALRLLRAAHQDADVALQLLDLSSLASIRTFAEALGPAPIDLLINNAGLMALPYGTTEDGFEMQLGVNHLGHFALTGLLFERIVAAPEPRVVTVSSLAHHRGSLPTDALFHQEPGYGKWRAYAASKLANMLFHFELHRRTRARHSHLAAVACHPGYAATNLQQKGPKMTGNRLTGLVHSLGNALVAQPSEMGALPTLFAAVEPLESGAFIGPAGRLEMRGPPTKVRASRAARDPEAGARLWAQSIEATGVSFLPNAASAKDA
jgi:NAD(P)-dependent dehydrogenase (short-subunit alcohol dehydrogenase family)